MKYLTPTILIIASVLLFFGYAKKIYNGSKKTAGFMNIKELATEKIRFENGLESAQRISDKLLSLEDKKNSISDLGTCKNNLPLYNLF